MQAAQIAAVEADHAGRGHCVNFGICGSSRTEPRYARPLGGARLRTIRALTAPPKGSGSARKSATFPVFQTARARGTWVT
jgi:hypothetical protein